MGFVFGQDLTSVIAATLTGKRRDMAVAYWGAGAAKRLGISDAKGVRIICDLWSGNCNPHELEKLMVAGASVWDSPRLHAKVYIGDGQFVTTSANASINGLGEEGEGTEREAGWVAGDRDELKKARVWFKSLLSKATEVDDLSELKEWWSQRPPSRRPSKGFGARSDSLLAQVLADPASLPGVGFVFVNELSDDEAVDRAKKAMSREAADQDREIADWNPLNMFTGWSAGTVRSWPGHFFEYFVGKRGRLSVHALRLQLRSEKAEAVFCKRNWSGIATPLGINSSTSVSNADNELTTEFIRHSGGGEVFRSAHELANRLIQVVPDYASYLPKVASNDPEVTESQPVRAGRDADADKIRGQKLFKVGMLSWQPYNQERCGGFAIGKEVASITVEGNHTGARKDVYTVQVLGKRLTRRFEKIKDARMAGSAAYAQAVLVRP